MPHPHPGEPKNNLAENVALDEKKCVSIPKEELRKVKLERIERQLYSLIGEVQDLKTT